MPFPTSDLEQYRPLPQTRQFLGLAAELDTLPVVDCHKIGVVYVAARQTHETVILQNTFGSPDYTEFLAGLGQLRCTKDSNVYLGGLDRHGNLDGKFAYTWTDDSDHIVFHIATLMPNHSHDNQANEKKKHIGNTYVRIVWNDSEIDYAIETISGDFNFVNILIQPLATSESVPADASTERKFKVVSLQVRSSSRSVVSRRLSCRKPEIFPTLAF